MSGDQETGTPEARAREGLLRAVPALATLPSAHVRRLAEQSEQLVFQPGRVVVAEGDTAHRFYVIARGMAEIVQRGKGESAERLGRVGCGTCFGELGLLHDKPRAASVIVCGDKELVVLAIPAAIFHELVAPAMSAMVRASDGARALASVSGVEAEPPPGFALGIGLGAGSRATLRGKYADLPAGSVLMRSGARAERFFVVVSGALEVDREGTRIGQIGPGEFCGETGLLLGIPRTATIRAIQATRVWCLERPDFERFVAPRLLANQRSSKVVLERIAGMYSDRAETAA